MNEDEIFAVAEGIDSPSERAAYLDQACAGNPSLRRTVEQLLQASADAGSFLQHPPLGCAVTIDSDVGQSVRAAHDWTCELPFLQPCATPGRLGKLVGAAGEYEVLEVVGQGGMGAVLRALETKLSRVVAVKVMAPELAASPMAVKRFLREATTAAAVHHEHVVTIHAIDETHRPPFLVMQFVAGQTLQQKIEREGALDVKQILRIGSQMAAGLAAAHKQGLIHRDVKPANILLENGVERVKISDFGLARAADDLEMTKAGVISGTPPYMSPEQAIGDPMDARSDLFSLGSVLYTMCTGRPAFRAATTLAVLRRVCDDTPRPIRELNQEIPEWLETIISKLLAKDPRDRFQTSREVADLLSGYLAHVQNPASFPAPGQLLSPVKAKEDDAAPRYEKFPATSGLWRDMNMLVMHKDAKLPNVCVKSNRPATSRLKRRLVRHHPALYLTLLINPLLYLVLALALQKSATVYVPLSDEWIKRRWWRMAVAWTSVLASVALLIFVTANNDRPLEQLRIVIWLSAILLFGGTVFGLVGCRLVRAARISADHLWIRGVHPQFLERLTAWEGRERS